MATETAQNIGAHLEWHTYSSGKSFALAVCLDCGILLNSGHHYNAETAHFARTMCDEHNEERHPTTECDYCHKLTDDDDLQECRSAEGLFCPDCHREIRVDHSECFA